MLSEIFDLVFVSLWWNINVWAGFKNVPGELFAHNPPQITLEIIARMFISWESWSLMFLSTIVDIKEYEDALCIRRQRKIKLFLSMPWRQWYSCIRSKPCHLSGQVYTTTAWLPGEDTPVPIQ